jgi:hypothetical protein
MILPLATNAPLDEVSTLLIPERTVQENIVSDFRN